MLKPEALSPDQFETLLKHRIEVEREFAKALNTDNVPIPIELLRTLNNKEFLTQLFYTALGLYHRRSVDILRAAHDLNLPITSVLGGSLHNCFEAYDLGYISKEYLLERTGCNHQGPIVQTLFLPEQEDNPIIFQTSCLTNDYFYENQTISAEVNYKIYDLKKDNWALLKKLRLETDLLSNATIHKAGEAIYYDNVEQLRILVEQPSFDINCCTEFRNVFSHWVYNKGRCFKTPTLIQFAALNRSINCFKFLLMKEADVSNVFQYACAGGCDEIINICIERNFNPDNAISYAIRYHQNEIVKWLIEQKKYPLDNALEQAFEFENTEGLLILRRKTNLELNSFCPELFDDESLLLFGDSMKLSNAKLKQLIKNAINKKYYTALKFIFHKFGLSNFSNAAIQCAIHNDDLEALRILVEYGISLPEKCIIYGENVYDFLIQNGVIIEEKQPQHHNESSLLEYISHLTPEESKQYLNENILLPLPAKKELFNKIKTLGSEQIDVEKFFFGIEFDEKFANMVLDCKTQEELQNLSFIQNFNLIPLLAKRGINFNVYNEDGFTPLHCSIKDSFPYLFVALVQNGADPKLKPKNGQSAFDLFKSSMTYPYFDSLPYIMEYFGVPRN